MNSRSPSEYMVKLADGNRHCFYPATIFDPDSHKTLIFTFKVRTVVDVYDEDWKTAIAQHKERIPANTELEVLNVINNYYGRWLEVMYNKSIYIIDPSQVEYAGSVKRYL